VYSYAVIVWEMLMRQKPWNHLHEFSEIEAQVSCGAHEEIPESVYKNNQLKIFLTELIKVSWAQNPFERPTFADIVTQLDLMKVDAKLL